MSTPRREEAERAGLIRRIRLEFRLHRRWLARWAGEPVVGGHWEDLLAELAVELLKAEDAPALLGVVLDSLAHEPLLSADAERVTSALAALTEGQLREFARALGRVRRQYPRALADRVRFREDTSTAVHTTAVDARNERTPDQIRRMLEQLAPVDREIVRLHLAHDLTHAQVAVQLGLTADAVRKRFERALDEFRLYTDD